MQRTNREARGSARLHDHSARWRCCAHDVSIYVSVHLFLFFFSQTHVAAHQTQADAPSPASQCICAAACIATQALTGVFRYSGTKFFVEGLSQGLRKECAGSGVKVTCIQPGDTHSGIPACTTDEAARAEFAQSSQDRNLWLDASDVAAAVVWALSQPSHVAVNEVLVEPVQAPA